MNPTYSILVNTSDGYDDCWAPFFKLLRKYWPACDAVAYLNTGNKVWKTSDWPTLICTQIERGANHRMTWSECLLAALDRIETPLVLYFQEDYFVHQPVRDDLIRRATQYMLDHPDVGHVALTPHCSYGPYDTHPEPWLQTIRQKARYRVSTQAGLWRVDTLHSYLDPVENGWMFEIFGTWRAHRRSDVFLSTKWDSQLGGPAIDYLHTGVIKGRWLKQITEVFAHNGIHIDLAVRGYYEPKHPLLHKIEVAEKLLQNPRHMLRQLFSS